MTQTGDAARRASRCRSTAAAASRGTTLYFLENRLRERFHLEGIPVIVDFVERSERRGERRAGARPR